MDFALATYDLRRTRRFATLLPMRVLPAIGMPVEVHHLGAVEEAVVEAIEDEGRCLVVAGERYTLRAVNGRFVRAGEPYFGTRLAFRGRR
jgi:hypothetical protein